MVRVPPDKLPHEFWSGADAVYFEPKSKSDSPKEGIEMPTKVKQHTHTCNFLHTNIHGCTHALKHARTHTQVHTLLKNAYLQALMHACMQA